MQLSEMFLFLVNSRHAALNWRTGDPYFCTRARTTGSPHDRSAGPQTDEYMPNPEGTLSFRTSAHRRREGFSMLEQTVCGEAVISGWVFAERSKRYSNSEAAIRSKQDGRPHLPRPSSSLDLHSGECRISHPVRYQRDRKERVLPGDPLVHRA